MGELLPCRPCDRGDSGDGSGYDGDFDNDDDNNGGEDGNNNNGGNGGGGSDTAMVVGLDTDNNHLKSAMATMTTKTAPAMVC